MYDQPIVACATPRGEGAVSIVRISGSGVFPIADRCFTSAGGGALSSSDERQMVYGTFHDPSDEKRLIDRCLAVRFVGPRSFSGENMVEFHVHGNPLIVDYVIRVCAELGCRPAEPGEFSRRAFFNGKMDLTQAEALAEVIRAESETALDLAQRQLGGVLSSKFNVFRRRLVDFLALLELELDFVQEGYSLIDQHELESTIAELGVYTDSLLDLYKSGDRLRRGPRILLLGRPNAGKSSLFNAILGYSRALVSETPGTTRDYIEERILHHGVILHLLDTAGLRSTDDLVESEGVSRARDLLPMVDHVLYLIDGSLSPEEIQGELHFARALRSEYPDTLTVPVFTKSDRCVPPAGYVHCSIYDGQTVIGLLDTIVKHYSRTVSDRLALLSERQVYLLREIRGCIDSIVVDSAVSSEFLSSDLRQLLKPLSELTGEITNEDILDAVFSGFCIGK